MSRKSSPISPILNPLPDSRIHRAVPRERALLTHEPQSFQRAASTKGDVEHPWVREEVIAEIALNFVQCQTLALMHRARIRQPQREVLNLSHHVPLHPPAIVLSRDVRSRVLALGNRDSTR